MFIYREKDIQQTARISNAQCVLRANCMHVRERATLLNTYSLQLSVILLPIFCLLSSFRLHPNFPKHKLNFSNGSSLYIVLYGTGYDVCRAGKFFLCQQAADCPTNSPGTDVLCRYPSKLVDPVKDCSCCLLSDSLSGQIGFKPGVTGNRVSLGNRVAATPFFYTIIVAPIKRSDRFS